MTACLRILPLIAGIFCIPLFGATDVAGQKVPSKSASDSTISLRDSIPLQKIPQADNVSAIDNGEIELETNQSVPEADTGATIEKPPVLLTTTQPEYPVALSRQGIEGTITFDILINEKGAVDSVRITRGIHPVIDSLMLALARGFVFTPALLKDDTPVAVLIQFEKTFSIAGLVKAIVPFVNFSGRIIEKGTKLPIADAMVTLSFSDSTSDNNLTVPFSTYINHISAFAGQFMEEGRLTTMTDSTGKFQFFSLPCGTINITVNLPGCEPFLQQETILPHQEAQVSYFIKRITPSDYEIIVYGKAPGEKEVSHRQITVNEVKKLAGFGGDAVKVVQALPGVARPTMGMSEIVVRGSKQDDSKFYIDGIEIPILFHYGQKSTYNSEALGAVNFYPGGFGSRYGDAIGGVIDLTGRPGKTDRVHVVADANFYDGTAFIEGPLNKKKTLSFIGTARRSFIGDLISAVLNNLPDNQMAITGAPYYWDYIARIDADLCKNHHAYATFFGAKEGFKIVSSRNASSDISATANELNYETMFGMFIAGSDWKISPLVTNTFRFSLLKGKQSNNNFGRSRTDVGFNAIVLRDEMRYAPGKKFSWFTGIDMTLSPISVNFAYIASGSNTPIQDSAKVKYGDVGAYLFLEYKPKENIQIVPGIRYDYYRELYHSGAVLPAFWDYKDITNTSGVSGEPSLRLNARYEFVKNHSIKASVGNYNQSPKPRVEYIMERFGNPLLNASRAAQYVLGYEWQITDILNLDVQGYYNRQWRLPRYNNDTNVRVPVVDDGKKYATGLEIMLKHDQNKHFFGWAAYSLSLCKEFDYGLNKYVLFDKDQTHNFILVGTFFLSYGWDIGLKVQYTTGDPETPITGAYYSETGHRFVSIYGEKNSGRLPPTFQLDIRFDKKFIMRKYTFSVYLDFVNIAYLMYKSPQFNFPNGDYPFDYKKGVANREYIYMYSMPSIGLNGEF